MTPVFTDIPPQKVEEIDENYFALDSNFESQFCVEDKQHVLGMMNIRAVESDYMEMVKWLKHPVQTGCNTLRRIGTGHTLLDRAIWDGHKFVCLDDFPSNKPCLVYSFGINNEFSFEVAMARKGCIVYGFDHTVEINSPTSRFKHFQFGITSEEKAEGEFKHFEQILRENEHLNSTINYLKIDIEGHERDVISDMIQKGLLSNVQQIGMEIHHCREFFISSYATMFQQLYALGFKAISYEPNFYSQLEQDYTYPLFEVVLRRTEICGNQE